MSFYPIVVLGVALCVLLYGEWKDAKALVWLSKPIASASFVALAYVLGAMDSPFGRMILLALVLSAIGDILLIPKNDTIFKLGVLAFLAAHVTFIVAFIKVGLVAQMAWPFLLVMAGFSFFVFRWLWPHVPRDMKIPIVVYMVVITFMVAMAAGASPRVSPFILFAAIFFYFSDISVARDKFVKPGFVNIGWGLPCYYFAQVLFALSVAQSLSNTLAP